MSMSKHVVNLNKYQKNSCVVTYLFPVFICISKHNGGGTSKDITLIFYSRETSQKLVISDMNRV